MRDTRRNLDDLHRVRFGDRDERPDDAEHERDKERDAEYALEASFLAASGRPGEFIFSVKR